MIFPTVFPIVAAIAERLAVSLVQKSATVLNLDNMIHTLRRGRVPIACTLFAEGIVRQVPRPESSPLYRYIERIRFFCWGRGLMVSTIWPGSRKPIAGEGGAEFSRFRTHLSTATFILLLTISRSNPCCFSSFVAHLMIPVRL